MPGTVVMVYDDDLLPGAQNELPIPDRYRKARSHETGPEMGKSVIIPPGLRMPTLHIAGSEFFQQFL